MSLFMTACSESFDDWADPQSNGQDDAQTLIVDVQPVAPIDFANVDGEVIQVFEANYTVPENTNATTVLTIYNEDRTKSVEVEATPDGYVSTEEFRSAIENLYGKRPVERVAPIMVVTRLNVNDQNIRMKGETTVTVLLTAPVIESAYYLIGAHQGWSTDTYQRYKFSRADESADVYDDPVFTIVVPAPRDDSGARVDFWFNIVPASAVGKTGDDFWHGLIGSNEGNGDSRLEAGLAYKVNGADNAFMQPSTDGAMFYKVTIDMMDYKMTVKPLSFEQFIYVPGNHQNWSPEHAAALRSPNFDGVYEGYSYLNGEFKFTKARNWDAEYNYNDFTTFSEGLSQGGGSNINMETPGFYRILADVANGTLTATKTEWGIIGPAQPGGWDADTDMTYDAADNCWTATLALTAGEFKFRANDAWTINVGGDINDLVQDGGNLSIPEAGTYTVKLYLSRITGENYYCTLERQQ